MSIAFTSTARRTAGGLTLILACGLGHAHDGHGATGLHAHASDALGFVLVTLVAALALWLGRGR